MRARACQAAGAVQNATPETLRKYWKHARYKRTPVTNCQRLRHKVCPVPQDGRVAASEKKGDTMFIESGNACNRMETLLFHNKVALLHKVIEIRRIMDK